MFGAARNGSCKTSRFDCRFVIEGVRSRGSAGQEKKPERADEAPPHWPPKPLGTPAQSEFAAVATARHKMNLYSFLMSLRMRITHRKIVSRRYERAFRPSSGTATYAA